MRKFILIALVGLCLTACSTPMDREETVADYGEIVWRQNPSGQDIYEVFLCRDEHGTPWIVSVTDGNDLNYASKISGYKLINSGE